MTVYFTYCITNRITGQHYYGARWKDGCHPKDLWTTYFTSSKHVHNLIKEHGKDSFDIQVRKTFDTKEKCLSHEQKVLKRLKVKKREDWLNVAIGKPTFLGKKHTPETLAKMRKPKTVGWTEERRLAKSIQEKRRLAEGGKKPPGSDRPISVNGIIYSSAKAAYLADPKFSHSTYCRYAKAGKNNIFYC